MAGCFGNSFFDRNFERQLLSHLAEESERECCSCNGWEESNCCGALIIHSDICSDCNEHCSNQCEDCEYKQDEE